MSSDVLFAGQPLSHTVGNRSGDEDPIGTGCDGEPSRMTKLADCYIFI